METKKGVMKLVQKAVIDSMNFSRERDRNLIFVGWSPHCQMVTFSGFKGKWMGTNADFNISIYLDGTLSQPSIESCKLALAPLYEFINENKKQ